MYDAHKQSTLDVPLRKVACQDLGAIEWNAASSSYFMHWDQLTLPVTILWVQGNVRVVERRCDSIADGPTAQYDVQITDHSGTVDAVADENELVELDQIVDGDYCGALLELRDPEDGQLNLRCVRLTPMPAAFHSLWIQELDAYRSQLCK